MSKILNISAYNFVTYKDLSFDLSDDRSIFIGGDNRDAIAIESNGVGKSLIYDAIVWGLYDVTVRGFGKDQVIGPFDSYTTVDQTWLDDAKRIIRIRRYRSHPKHGNGVKIEINGVDASKVTTIAKYGSNAQIVKLIGIDSISFLHSIVFSKGRGSICDEKESGRRKLL
jgi:DNA repair exonuclease SbcCD ATPase subunit